MFEKWRIKEHMEVSDANGQHIGTVDSVDGDVVKLTRTDSADGQHHYIDVKWVDKIDENRAWLSADAPLAGPSRVDATTGSARTLDDTSGYDGEAAADAGFVGESGAEVTKPDAPLFGTSGRGTGMGGSGTS